MCGWSKSRDEGGCGERQGASDGAEERAGAVDCDGLPFGGSGGEGWEDWAKQFQKDQVPEEVETESVSFAEFANREGDGVRLAKILVKIGFAASTSEADRKIKEGAVSVDGVKATTPVVKAAIGATLTVRLGRKIKKVLLAGS